MKSKGLIGDDDAVSVVFSRTLKRARSNSPTPTMSAATALKFTDDLAEQDEIEIQSQLDAELSDEEGEIRSVLGLSGNYRKPDFPTYIDPEPEAVASKEEKKKSLFTGATHDKDPSMIHNDEYHIQYFRRKFETQKWYFKDLRWG